MLFVRTVNYLTLYNSFLYNYADIVCTFCTYFYFEECIEFIARFGGLNMLLVFFILTPQVDTEYHSERSKFLYLMILYYLCDKTCVFYS